MNNTIEEVFTEPLAKMQESIQDIPVATYTLADAILDGSNFTEQAFNWGGGEKACALSAAAIAAKAHGFI